MNRPAVGRMGGALCVMLIDVLIVAAHAFAEEAHHAEHAEHGSPWLTLTFMFVNFVLFVAVLRRFVWPSVQGFIRDRHASVVAELEAAAHAKQEAEQLRLQWQQRMANLDAELEALRAEAQRDIAGERDRVLAAAQKTAETIRRDAERAAAAEVRRVQEQLRSELVQQALRIATDRTRASWSSDDQQRAVNEFLKRVQ